MNFPIFITKQFITKELNFLYIIHVNIESQYSLRMYPSFNSTTVNYSLCYTIRPSFSTAIRILFNLSFYRRDIDFFKFSFFKFFIQRHVTKNRENVFNRRRQLYCSYRWMNTIRLKVRRTRSISRKHLTEAFCGIVDLREHVLTSARYIRHVLNCAAIRNIFSLSRF